jgi:hypothetical protein
MFDSTAYTLRSQTPELAGFLPRSEPPHLKITGAAPAIGFERCEDTGCRVARDGTASSCGRLACPFCGCGGTNLETMPLLEASGLQIHCSCGHAWVREDRDQDVPVRFAASF